jgi:hypothetical protein
MAPWCPFRAFRINDGEALCYGKPIEPSSFSLICGATLTSMQHNNDWHGSTFAEVIHKRSSPRRSVNC